MKSFIITNINIRIIIIWSLARHIIISEKFNNNNNNIEFVYLLSAITCVIANRRGSELVARQPFVTDINITIISNDIIRYD